METLPLPPSKIRFMGDRDDDEMFLRAGARQVSDLRELAGLAEDSDVLDVGCAYGRLAHALARDQGFGGSYVGLDIRLEHLEWCREALGNERFRFEHIDVANDRYNPAGAEQAAHADWPVGRRSVDVVMLASVFTHMWPREVRHYLRLCRRVLRPGGRGLASFFLLNDSWREADAQGLPKYRLPHRRGSIARYHSEENPLHVIAYEQDWVVSEVRRAGLEVDDLRLGGWATRERGGAQDLVAFRRPAR